ncbi:MAG TPA: DM13 domain-containing protein [Kribbella sp.]|jgi:hypothetical protein
MPTPSRRALAVTAVAVATVAAALALQLFQPWRLFTDKVVDEALPGAGGVSMTSSSPVPPTISGDPGSTPTSPQAATSSAAPEPVLLTTGKFVTHEHQTSGSAAILRLPDGSRVLRLEGLDTSDGPDLKVWLSDAGVVADKAGWHVFDDGRYLSLGQLKGNHGNQNYAIPAGVDLADFRSVSIWCDRFNVSFGAAPLSKA